MKTLYLLRHAKSSWNEPGLDDYHRPLNHRGEKDAPKMGKRLRKSDVHVSLIISSPAVRALHTARLIGEELGVPTQSIREEKNLYHAGPEAMLSIIRSLSDSLDKVMLVGHNPGLTEFADQLLDEDLGNIPTAGVIEARLKIDSWKDASWGCGVMVLYEYPKKD